MNKKSLIKFFFLTTFLVFVVTNFVLASEVSINSATKIPAGTNWSTNIEFDLDSLNELKVFLDDELIITVFEFNKKVFVDSTLNSNKLLSHNFDKRELVLSLMGLVEGTYYLEAKIYSEGKLIESDSKKIFFYNLEDKVNSLEDTIRSQNNLISTLKEDLNKKSIELEDLVKQNESLTQDIIDLNSSITELRESDANKAASLQRINNLFKLDEGSEINNEEIDSQGTDLFGTNFAGLFGLNINSFSLLILVGVICLIILGVIIYQENFREKGLYG